MRWYFLLAVLALACALLLAQETVAAPTVTRPKPSSVKVKGAGDSRHRSYKPGPATVKLAPPRKKGAGTLVKGAPVKDAPATPQPSNNAVRIKNSRMRQRKVFGKSGRRAKVVKAKA
ncbi:hypothetical protein HDU96_005434 [Phlyctochytrium bullatum]|nr:hypothetical protein HDU96_005434 [Phlyctochytrium bullatum]